MCAPGECARALCFEPPPPQPAARTTIAPTAAAGAKRGFTIPLPVLEDCGALEAGPHVLLRHKPLAGTRPVLRRAVQCTQNRPGPFIAARLPRDGARSADRDGVLVTRVVVRVEVA